MKILFVFLLTLVGCSAENFVLKFMSQAFKNEITGNDESCSSSQGLQVISAGLARTGSASLQEALKILGYKPYHMSEVVGNDHSELWNRVITTGGKEGIGDVASAMIDAGYDSTTDSPSADFSLQLLDLFPDAKVILSTRPEERWLRSALQIAKIAIPVTLQPFSLIPRFVRFVHTVRNLHCMHWNGCMLCDDFKGDVEDEVQRIVCLDYFRSHNEKVRKSVPASQLLEFQPSEGWEPLCRFLDKPVPNQPFPHINSSNTFLFAKYVFWAIAILYHMSLASLACYVILRWIVPLTGIPKLSYSLPKNDAVIHSVRLYLAAIFPQKK